MASLRPLQRAAAQLRAGRSTASSDVTMQQLRGLATEQLKYYKYEDDGSFSTDIAPINREEASNPDLFHATLVARLRGDNKRSTRAVRRSGWIPSYFRGRGKIPDLMLQVPAAPFKRDWEGGFMAKATLGRVFQTGPLYELRVEEGATDDEGNMLDVSWIPFERVRVLAQNVKIHPIDYVPWGVQLTYVPENEPVRVRVPVLIKNSEKSPGMRDGGWVNNIIKHVDINVAPFVKPPTKCVLDIAGMKMKERRYIADLEFEGKGDGCRTVLPDDTLTTMVTKP